MKYLAVIQYHTGDVEELELPDDPEMIEDIVDAVEGQYTYVDNESGLCVCGDNITHIDIYKEDKDGIYR